MGNAVWLFWALPQWYFQSILSPFAAGPLTIIPASGIVALAIGLALAVRAREAALWWLLIPAALPHAYVALAGLFRGQVNSDWPFWPFIAIETLALAAVILRTRRRPIPALLIGWFCLTYAFFAGFLGAMSFSDTWL